MPVKQIVTLLVCVCLAQMGCGRKSQKVTVMNQPLLKEIACIGVFPLKNLSGADNAEQIVARLFENSLSAARGFAVMENGDIKDALKEKDLNVEIQDDLAAIRRLGSQLRLDGVLVGTIYDYGYRNSENRGEEDPFISYQVKLVHVATGSTVWSATINRSSDEITSRNRDPLSRVAMLAVDETTAGLSKVVGVRDEAADLYQRCGQPSAETNNPLLNR